MEIEITQILLQALNFGILFVLLSKLLFKPILKILDSRSDKIAAGLAAAEKSLKEAEKLEEKKAAELAKIEQRAAVLIADAKKEAKEAGNQLVEQARTEAAKATAKQESIFLARLKDEEAALKGRVAELVVATTERVLGEALSTKELNAVTKKAIAKLK